MPAAASSLARGAVHISKRIIFSYVLDWLFIVGIAAVGAGFNRITYSTKRSFVLQDPSLSYPYKDDTVSIGVAALIALVAPAVIMFIISIALIPGRAASRGVPSALKWRRKLWEWNTSWMGLALSCASAFMVTEGLKDLAGKPRPHAIVRCQPDLDAISQYQVGGLGTVLGQALPIMVDVGICRQPDAHALRDAFASWPSGHSSFSFAGLLYLSLFLAAKFSVTIPFLSPMSWRKQQAIGSFFGAATSASTSANAAELGRPNYPNQINNHGPNGEKSHVLRSHPASDATGNSRSTEYAPRNQAAAPPVYLLVVVFVPIAVALFICVSRWFDYHHHGFDIISGALIGIFTAWFSFRFYHMPIQRSAGFSWGARTRDRALWIGVGREGYVGNEGWESAKYDRARDRDLEMGKMNSGNVGSMGMGDGDDEALMERTNAPGVGVGRAV